jgi:hypothetical protein
MRGRISQAQTAGLFRKTINHGAKNVKNNCPCAAVYYAENSMRAATKKRNGEGFGRTFSVAESFPLIWSTRNAHAGE